MSNLPYLQRLFRRFLKITLTILSLYLRKVEMSFFLQS